MDKVKKIVVVGPQHPDTLPKSVLETLREMSYEVHSVDEREVFGISFAQDIEKRGRLGLKTRIKKRIIEFGMQTSTGLEKSFFEKIADNIEKHNPDLIITHSAWIPPEIIKRLKKNLNAKLVCWFPDHPQNLGRQYILAAPYDFLFFKDKWIVERAKTIGKNAFYLPEACMPKWHKKVDLTDDEKKYYGCDITTAGNIYYFRAIILENLMKRYDVKLWGSIPRWVTLNVRDVFMGKNVTEIEKSKAFNGAKIVLNTFQGEVEGVNQRFFEIAGCGGFQICEHRDEVSSFFEIGREIVTFNDLNDLHEKVKYYLSHPEERKKIADAAYKKAHKFYTFRHRLSEMIEIILKSEN